MEIEFIKKLIKDHKPGHIRFIAAAEQGTRYYLGKTDILYKNEEDTNNPLKKSTNKIPTNWQSLLVDQKASYLFTYPPLFDVGSKQANAKITDTLGDEFPKVCKDLCVEASNKSVAWLHVWEEEGEPFNYAVVPAEQIIPLWSSDLKKKLIAVFRTYTITADNGKIMDIYEYWTEAECYAYQKESSKTVEELEEANIFSLYDVDSATLTWTNIYKHSFGTVPFIPFFNNNTNTNDLQKVKAFIDAYDGVISGFVNDVQDTAEIVFILRNYGGTDLKDFVKKLKQYGVVNFDTDGDEQSGLETLQVNIPVEAKNSVLEIAKKQIYTMGQGVNPDLENTGNASGVALEYLYSLLELKAGLTETEFRLGFSRLITILCGKLGIKCGRINQTWTRNKVRNDQETAQIAVQSQGVISKRTILENHPWVNDVEEELSRLAEEEAEEDKKLYNPVTTTSGKEPEDLNEGQKEVAGNGNANTERNK